MNKLQILLLTILAMACSVPEKFDTVDKAQAESTIDQLLTAWHDAAASANADDYWQAMDSISFFYGTDASEYWTKEQFQSFANPVFNEGRGWDFDAINRHIYFSEGGDVAWFDELLNTWMGVCIGSGVLEKKGEEWKIKHYVLSVIVPNDDIMPVLEAKRANDSTFIVSKGLELKVR